MTSITNDHSVSTDDNESKSQVVLPTAKKPHHNIDDSHNDHHYIDINANDDEEQDDTRHMNDSTMPPPKNLTPPTNMPPPKSKIITTTKPRVATTTTNFKTPAEIATGRRSKTPTALGLGDWMRLLSVTKDIAQLKGQSIRRNITKQEVQQHRTIHDGWIILHNTRVYNISPYLSYHPGGINIMKSVLGKDATTLFQKYHPWVNIDGLIGKLLIGYLDTTGSNDSSEDEES